MPEKIGSPFPVLVATHLTNSHKTDNLGYLGIGMQTRKSVFTLKQWIKNKLVRKSLSHNHVPLITCNLEYVGKVLVKTSMLGSQHILQLLIAQIAKHTDKVVTKTNKYFFGLLITSVVPHINKTCKEFVDIVEGNPPVIQTNIIGSNIAIPDFLSHCFPTWNTSYIALTIRFLTSGQFNKHVVKSLVGFTITFGCSNQSQ